MKSVQNVPKEKQLVFYKRVARYLYNHAELTTGDMSFLDEMRSSVKDGDILMDDIDDACLNELYEMDDAED